MNKIEPKFYGPDANGTIDITITSDCGIEFPNAISVYDYFSANPGIKINVPGGVIGVSALHKTIIKLNKMKKLKGRKDEND